VIHVVERSQTVPRPRGEIFAFFADASNLELMTPPNVRFDMLTPQPIEMHVGTRIDYRIAIHGIPFTWKLRVDAFVPLERFEDEQIAGPYKRWHHTHTFRDAPGGGTVVGDRVDYEVGFGPLGELANALVVKRQLRAIFAYRERVLRERFG
jgi:ligand-binding SRPBCC domain-containing protein